MANTGESGLAWLFKAFRWFFTAEETPSPEFIFTGFMETHVGLVRGSNEDAVGYAIFDGQEGPRRAGLVVVVADGMGGSVHGEIASRLAVGAVMSVFSSEPPMPPKFALAQGFEDANAAILKACRDDEDLRGMGTTCTALAIEAGYAYLAHIGDSRAYHLRNGAITQISEDHSLVAQLLKDGLITAEEAAIHPDRNVILRALGLDADERPDLWASGLAVESGDVFCLCSDGLSNLVDMETIGLTIATLEPESACFALRDAALEAGGTDNISIGIFRVLSPEVDSDE